MMSNFPYLEKALLPLEERLGIFSARRAISKSFFEYTRQFQQSDLSDEKQEFWEPIFEAHLITGICIATGARASEHFPETSLSKLKPHKHIKPQQAVMIFSLGKILFVEWSHLGKCRLWKLFNPCAPLLYKRTYSLAELTAYPDYTQQHHRTSIKTWQKQLLTWIDKGF